ncbi:MAG: class I SAM-dependent methyltransferase [Verrucomicrobiota bacterium]
MKVVAGNLYDKYGTRNPVARRLMDGFLGAMRDVYDAGPDETVIEIGCGEGELLARLQRWRPARRVIGFDVSPEILKEARVRHGLTVALQSAEQLGLRAGAADVVIASEVLEHLQRPEAALREIGRVARRRVILSVPREPLWRVLNCARLRYLPDLGNTPGHLQHFSTRAFVALVSRWLRVVDVRTPLPWTIVAAEPR